MPARIGTDRDAAYLKDIVDSCETLAAYVRGKTLEDFKADPMLQDAAARRLYVVGEAAKGVSEGIRRSLPAVDWRNIARLRDKLGHHYWSIEIEKIWEIVVNDIPALHNALRKHPMLST